MSDWFTVGAALIGAVGASSGFWAYVLYKSQNKSAFSRLVMGLAYKELVTSGIEYIDRGYVTREEYEEYRKYYFEPYKALGGNGVAERIMNEVMALPFHSKSKYEDILNARKNEEFINNVRVVPPVAAE